MWGVHMPCWGDGLLGLATIAPKMRIDSWFGCWSQVGADLVDLNGRSVS